MEPEPDSDMAQGADEFKKVTGYCAANFTGNSGKGKICRKENTGFLRRQHNDAINIH